MIASFSRLALCLATGCLGAFAQALQIHFIDVGHGDASLVVSPNKETILFDSGPAGQCDRLLAYLQQEGIASIDYLVATHYHADHIGCAAVIMRAVRFQKVALDRGGDFPSETYRRYERAVLGRRRTAQAGMQFLLDAGTKAPVTIQVVAVNGNGELRPKSEAPENDLGLVAVIRFGGFAVSMGGDIEAAMETKIADKVGEIDVYKVHFHGSRSASSTEWLAKTRPKVGVISVGVRNPFGHPSQESLDRLHAANVKTFWTSRGNGAGLEAGLDTVGGNIVVQVKPGEAMFTVTHSGTVVQQYPVRGATPPLASGRGIGEYDPRILEQAGRVGPFALGAPVRDYRGRIRQTDPTTYEAEDASIVLGVDAAGNLREISVHRSGMFTQRLVTIGQSTMQDVMLRYGKPQVVAGEGTIILRYEGLAFVFDGADAKKNPLEPLKRPVQAITLSRRSQDLRAR